MTADHFYNQYGADMVRLWVSSVDYQNEVPFSEDLFKQTGESYRRIRNTLRVLLGNLHDFDPATHTVAAEEMPLLDRWILERLHRLTRDCVDAYDRYDFRRVFTVVNQFLATDLSAIYIDATKDRMYCDPGDSTSRRATQTAMRAITQTLCRLLAPILAFTADETWEHLGHQESVHLQLFPEPDPAYAEDQAGPAISQLLDLRALLQQEIEKARQARLIGANLEAAVTLTLPETGYDHAVFTQPDTLREFFIISDLTVDRASHDTPSVTVTRSAQGKCARCWRHLPDVGEHTEHPALCGRCVDALS